MLRLSGVNPRDLVKVIEALGGILSEAQILEVFRSSYRSWYEGSEMPPTLPCDLTPEAVEALSYSDVCALIKRGEIDFDVSFDLKKYLTKIQYKAFKVSKVYDLQEFIKETAYGLFGTPIISRFSRVELLIKSVMAGDFQARGFIDRPKNPEHISFLTKDVVWDDKRRERIPWPDRLWEKMMPDAAPSVMSAIEEEDEYEEKEDGREEDKFLEIVRTKRYAEGIELIGAGTQTNYRFVYYLVKFHFKFLCELVRRELRVPGLSLVEAFMLSLTLQNYRYDYEVRDSVAYLLLTHFSSEDINGVYSKCIGRAYNGSNVFSLKMLQAIFSTLLFGKSWKGAVLLQASFDSATALMNCLKEFLSAEQLKQLERALAKEEGSDDAKLQRVIFSVVRGMLSPLEFDLLRTDFNDIESLDNLLWSGLRKIAGVGWGRVNWPSYGNSEVPLLGSVLRFLKGTLSSEELRHAATFFKKPEFAAADAPDVNELIEGLIEGRPIRRQSGVAATSDVRFMSSAGAGAPVCEESPQGKVEEGDEEEEVYRELWELGGP